MASRPLFTASWWGTGESGEDQVTAVWVALRNAQLVAVFNGAADLAYIGEVQLRVNALGQHVQCQG